MSNQGDIITMQNLESSELSIEESGTCGAEKPCKHCRVVSESFGRCLKQREGSKATYYRHRVVLTNNKACELYEGKVK
jgi:hypothetical protein